jgi:hypothetical protein
VWEVQKPSRFGSELVLLPGSTVVFDVRTKTSRDKNDEDFDFDDVQWAYINKETSMRAYLRDGMVAVRYQSSIKLKKLKRKSRNFQYDCASGNLLYIGYVNIN